MSNVTEELLQEFKDRLHISHKSEDSHLKRLLSFSYADISDKCGSFSLETANPGKELVLERSRYAYNDALEYFNDNFLSQINSFALSNLPDEEAVDETEQV
ncbi:phage gp6-like head-tail connector protein [Terribacillus sp. DMT04]|uniref:phage gp6-like head-tail connector protein n=1 Tax=Terribacillus sp. DMT04 TaxID=2850441 RepID=UPI001C2C1211|nr:phage gp6-like head-tail connector protein [Terribacillus sp. DMT04]QXE02766.1 phage gp6-like head-tail connector protein [Terribacillus sp. DMT04]